MVKFTLWTSARGCRILQCASDCTIHVMPHRWCNMGYEHDDTSDEHDDISDEHDDISDF